MKLPMNDDPMDIIAELLIGAFAAVPVLDIDPEEYNICFGRNPAHTIRSEADLEQLAKENNAVWCPGIKVLDERLMHGVSFRNCKDASQA